MKKKKDLIKMRKLRIMKNEINERQEKDESILDEVKNCLNYFNKNLNLIKNERKDSQNKLNELVENTVFQIKNKQNIEVVSSI